MPPPTLLQAGSLAQRVAGSAAYAEAGPCSGNIACVECTPAYYGGWANSRPHNRHETSFVWALYRHTEDASAAGLAASRQCRLCGYATTTRRLDNLAIGRQPHHHGAIAATRSGTAHGCSYSCTQACAIQAFPHSIAPPTGAPAAVHRLGHPSSTIMHIERARL